MWGDLVLITMGSSGINSGGMQKVDAIIARLVVQMGKSTKTAERAALLPIRKAFELFANLGPVICILNCDLSPLRSDTVANGIDTLCVRELTGGIYFGQPKETTTLDNGEKQAVDTMVYRTGEIERITELAVNAAALRDGRICSVDKANVLETSVLWRETVLNCVRNSTLISN